MKKQLNKNLIERYSRQIVLKNIGTIGQKKILSSKVLIVGVGGLGSPVAEFLSRAGVGTIGIVDDDKVSLSNLHRQSLYNESDIGQSKVKIAKEKIKRINHNTKVKVYKTRLNSTNFKNLNINISIYFFNFFFCYFNFKLSNVRCTVKTLSVQIRKSYFVVINNSY